MLRSDRLGSGSDRLQPVLLRLMIGILRLMLLAQTEAGEGKNQTITTCLPERKVSKRNK